MIQGVDVHDGYGKINWAVACADVAFCWARCTVGNEPAKDDHQFAANVAGCKQHGVAVGAYHFAYLLPADDAHPGRSPEDQIDRFFAVSGGLGSQRGELAPVIDAEWPAPQDAAGWECTRLQISDSLRRACEHATLRFGRAPIVYTYPDWWRWLAAGADVSWASAYELWFADYAHSGPGTPPDGWQPPHLPWVASTWTDWAVCQYSAEGSTERIPGIAACPIDRDCIRDAATLARLTSL